MKTGRNCIWGRQRTTRVLLLTGLHTDSLTMSFSLSSRTGIVPQNSPGTDREELNGLTSRWMLECQKPEKFSLRMEVLTGTIVPLLNSPPTQTALDMQVPILSSPLNWLTPFTPPCWFPETLTYTTCLLGLSIFQRLLRTVDILKIFQRPTNTVTQCWFSAWLIALAKQLQAQQNWWLILTCIITPITWPQAWHKRQPVLAWNVASTKWPKA